MAVERDGWKPALPLKRASFQFPTLLDNSVFCTRHFPVSLPCHKVGRIKVCHSFNRDVEYRGVAQGSSRLQCCCVLPYCEWQVVGFAKLRKMVKHI